jgi:methionyl-tRNA formyltransferase
MNVIFLGATELGYRCCERLIEIGVHIAAIATIPRKFDISYSPGKKVENVLHKDFYALGEKYNIPVISIEGKMTEYKETFAAYNPDLFVVIGWYYMIPASLRSMAQLGCVGIHGSLLPKYRGGAPLVWAMINGETETGLTLFYMDEGVDTGDVIAQKKFNIGPTDTIADMLPKLEAASLEVVEEYIPLLLDGKAPRIVQDHTEATLFPQRKPEDGEIDWNWDKETIANFIKAQTKPYPGAFTYINEKKVIIWDAEIL